MTTKIEALKEKVGEIQKQLVAAGTEVLRESFDAIFVKYPQMESFGWHQYTPGFNDGDPCTFTVNTDDIEINGESVDEAEDFTSHWDPVTRIHTFTGEGAWKAEAADAISTMLSPLVDSWRERDDGTAMEILRQIYGNNVTVTVTKDGAEVDEYSCGY